MQTHFDVILLETIASYIRDLNDFYSFRRTCKRALALTTRPLTNFQCETLGTLEQERLATVPDMDNALIVGNSLSKTLIEKSIDCRLCFVGIDADRTLLPSDSLYLDSWEEIPSEMLCVVITGEEFPPLMDSDVFIVRIIDKVHCVDEFVPLWTSRITPSYGLIKRDIFYRFDNFFFGDVCCIGEWIEPTSFPEEKISSLTCIQERKCLLYSEIERYDTIVCHHSIGWRVASLLMQRPESSSPGNVRMQQYNSLSSPRNVRTQRPESFNSLKRLIFHGESWMQVVPLPVKMRYRFQTEVLRNLTIKAGQTIIYDAECTYADLCALVNFTNRSFKWVEKVTGNKCVIDGELHTRPEICCNRDRWLYLDPRCSLGDEVRTKDIPSGVPENKNVLLKKKVIESMTVKSGGGGRMYLTVAQAKAYCQKYGLSQNGTRRVLLQRLRDNL